MKLLFSILLIITVTVQNSNEPHKGATEIIVETELEDKELFMKWGQLLVKEGYTIESSNETFLIIESGGREIPGTSGEYKVIATFNEGVMSLKMKCRLKQGLMNSSTDYYDWLYKKGSWLSKKTHHQVMYLVNQFGGKVSYK